MGAIKQEEKSMAVAVIMVLLVIMVWVFLSAMESRTYNRLTGAKTTTVDAMFVQLRVQGSTGP